MDRWPTGYLLAVNLFAGAIGSAAVLTRQPGVEVIGAIVFGFSLMSATPAIITILLRRVVPEERYASSFSFMATLFAIGQALGPIFGGFAIDRVGLTSGIATTALVLLMASIFSTLYGIAQRRSQQVVLT
jgi:predicted MFS family arabinose efflux permease